MTPNEIFTAIKTDIFSGVLPEGSRLPAIREFAKKYNSTPSAVGKGISILMTHELVYSKKGIGLFVGPTYVPEWRFIQDNDSHWYCIEVADTHAFHRWVDANDDHDEETLAELKDFESFRCLHPNHYKFSHNPASGDVVSKEDWESEEYR